MQQRGHDASGANGWMTVPAFRDWDMKNGALPDYSMDFSKIREMRKQNKEELSRTSLDGDEDLPSGQQWSQPQAQTVSITSFSPLSWTEMAAPARSLDRDSGVGRNNCYVAPVQSKRDWGRGGELGNAARRIGDAATACESGERGVGMRGGGGCSGKYETRLKQTNVHGSWNLGAKIYGPGCFGNKFATPGHGP
jgi:hypothetical protein